MIAHAELGAGNWDGFAAAVSQIASSPIPENLEGLEKLVKEGQRLLTEARSSREHLRASLRSVSVSRQFQSLE